MKSTYIALPASPFEDSSDAEQKLLADAHGEGEPLRTAPRILSPRAVKATYSALVLALALAVAHFAAVIQLLCRGNNRAYLDQLVQPNVSMGLPQSRMFPSQANLP